MVTELFSLNKPLFRTKLTASLLIWGNAFPRDQLGRGLSAGCHSRQGPYSKIAEPIAEKSQPIIGQIGATTLLDPQLHISGNQLYLPLNFNWNPGELKSV